MSDGIEPHVSDPLQTALAWQRASGWPGRHEDLQVAAHVLVEWRRQRGERAAVFSLTQRLLEAFERIYDDGTAEKRAALCRIALEAYLRRACL